MFHNLSAEIKRTGLTNKEFAEKIGIHPGTFSRKLHGKVDFTLSEIKIVVDYFKHQFTAEYLFEIEAA